MYFILCLVLILPSALAGCKCGRRASQTRVVGGEPAKDGQFPWMAYVKQDIFWSDGNITGYNCGGSIINSDWVLTAGHCVDISGETRKGSFITKVEYFVAVGMTDVSPMYAESLYEYEGSDLVPKKQLPRGIHYVSETILHGRFNTWTLDNDIALLKVSKAFQFSPNVAPVCLETEREFYPKLEIAGWGRTATNKPSGVKLMHTTVSEVEYEDCSESIDYWKQICTTKGEHGACSGDSGGPYVVNKGGVYYEVALVSYRRGATTCEDSRLQNVETRVSYYDHWIRRNANSGHWCSP